ncbi:MAG: hypothetical protein KDC80_04335 [Saprospiraceae bacterium]|nr:hypothetical protein [Saprospiraceae bacterium]
MPVIKLKLGIGILFLLPLSVFGFNDFFIEGYTDHLSYVTGEKIKFHLSSSEEICSVEILRIGLHEDLVWSSDSINVDQYEVPENASSHGCNWPVAFTIEIPALWRTGYYEVRLRISDQGEKFIQRNKRTAESTAFFIIRNEQPGKDTNILLQLATNTYNAYNNWGGSSLYGYHGRANLQGHRVSFERPVNSLFYRWEFDFVKWAEKEGIKLDYAVNLDLEFHPEIMEHYDLVLSVGHDEYWSASMRDHLESFIAKGGNVAFLSGNSVCWQVRTEENGKALTSWKQWYNMDPVFQTGNYDTLSTLWSHHLVARPENQLTGVGFLFGGYHKSHGQFMDGSGAYTVHRPDNWILEGTGLNKDDQFGGKNTIVGYECDGCEMTWIDGLPVPTHRDGTPENFVIVATAPARWHPDDAEWYDDWEKGRTGAAVIGTYTNGGTVVTVGSTDWAHGLKGDDTIVERITRNIITRLSQR